MKYRKIVPVMLVCAMILASGCAASTGSSTPVEASVQGSSSEGSSAPDASSLAASSGSDEAQTPEANAVLPGVDTGIEGASVFRGVVEDFAVDDKGRTAWIMQEEGAASGASAVTVLVDEETKFSVDTASIGNGSQLEIAYIPEEGAEGTVTQIKALAVNSLEEAVPSVLYTGEVVAVEANPEKEGSGFFLLKPLEGSEETMEWQFNYAAETLFQLEGGLEAVKPGVKLTVGYNGISTRSLPPQSFAMEVSLADAPAAG